MQEVALRSAYCVPFQCAEVVCGLGFGSTGVVGEAGEPDTWVYDVLGGYDGGSGLKSKWIVRKEGEFFERSLACIRRHSTSRLELLRSARSRL